MLRLRLRVTSDEVHMQILEQSQAWYGEDPISTRYGLYVCSSSCPELDGETVYLRGTYTHDDMSHEKAIFDNHQCALNHHRAALGALLVTSRTLGSELVLDSGGFQ